MRNGDNTVWNLATGDRLGGFTHKQSSVDTHSVALSPDGRRVAMAANHHTSGTLDIWNVETGEAITRFEPGSRVRGVKWLAFAGPDQLVSYPGSVGDGSVSVWNLKTGEAEDSVTSPGPLSVGAVSGGGKYLAAAVQHKNLVLLYDLESKRLLDQLEFGAVGGFWDDCRGLAFSPDGTMLAGLYVGHPSQLRVWDLKTGQAVVNEAIAADPHGNLHGRKSYNGPDFVWSPDDAGWLCYGYFWIDRHSRQLTRELSAAGSEPVSSIQPLGDDVFAYAIPQAYRSTILCTEQLPSVSIDAAAPSDALLKRGDRVAIQIDMESVRLADKDKTEAACRQALSERLTQLGLKAAPEAKATLHLAHAETTGKVRPRPTPIHPLGLGPLRNPAPRKELPPQGSGFIISPDGLVVTCAHVVGDNQQVSLKIGERQLTAKVLRTDEKTDLALLKFEGRDEPCLTLRDSDSFELGEDVRSVGFPLTNLLGATIKVSKGTITGIDNTDQREHFVIDAALNPGSSGGPLIDQHGRVLGVNAKMLVGYDVNHIGMSVPINQLKPLLEKQKFAWPEGHAEPLSGRALVDRLNACVAIVTTSHSQPAEGSLSEATDTEMTDVLELRVAGRMEPVWSTKLTDQASVLVIRGDWNDTNLRDNAFERAVSRLKAIDMPYFVSANADNQLPQRVVLGDQLGAAANSP